jgi:hypothetical protein
MQSSNRYKVSPSSNYAESLTTVRGSEARCEAARHDARHDARQRGMVKIITDTFKVRTKPKI